MHAVYMIYIYIYTYVSSTRLLNAVFHSYTTHATLIYHVLYIESNAISSIIT